MKLSVEGYKSIAGKRGLDINGLTVLSGANSSGKSSFMQPFLLLKQTIENHYDTGSLMLDGENVRLTDSNQIISKVPTYSKKSFSVFLEIKGTETEISYRYKSNHGIVVDYVKVDKSENFPNGLTLKANMKPSEIESQLPDEDFSFIKEIYGEKNIKSQWKNKRYKCFIHSVLEVKGDDFMPLRAGVRPTDSLEKLITKLIHVPGLRGNPERNYKIAASENIYPGSFEKYVASIITKWCKPNRSKVYAEKYEELSQQLIDLGLANSISSKKVNDTRVELNVSRYKGSNDKDIVNIADVGFGVSQTLPVLVALLCAKKDQIVYIEQPELHLHPKAQFKLVKILTSAVNRGIHVVIETHSSILLRGLQIEVVKKTLEHNKVSLNWFTQNAESGETQVSTADLDEFGAFGDWPEDFDEINLNVEKMYLDAIEEAISAE